MGREVRRVALDFNWPLNKRYEGFINPHPYGVQCPKCENGNSPYGQLLQDRWYGKDPNWKPEDRGSRPFTPEDECIKLWSKRQCEHSPEYYGTGPLAEYRESLRICDLFNKRWCHHLNDDDVAALVAAGRLHDYTHTWDKTERKWVEKPDGKIPTARELNEAYIFGMGHDAINSWAVLKAEAAREGKSLSCDHCDGEGIVWDDLICSKEKYEAWTPTDPPAGEGWQIWETVSEGSPITPVFPTSDALAAYMEEHGDPVWGKTMNAAQWKTWIEKQGWAPSMMSVGGTMMSGVEAIVLHPPKPETKELDWGEPQGNEVW